MNSLLILGVAIVNLALVAYTLFFIFLMKRKVSGKWLLTFLFLGVIFDIFSTICMISGSSNSPLTIHGFIGYIALLGMVVDTFLIVRFIKWNGFNSRFSNAVRLASIIFYSYWVAAYFTGLILVTF